VTQRENSFCCEGKAQRGIGNKQCAYGRAKERCTNVMYTHAHTGTMLVRTYTRRYINKDIPLGYWRTYLMAL